MKIEKDETVIAPEVATEPIPRKEVKTYDNSHLVMFCGKCNSRYILKENIPSTEGVMISMPPTSEAEFILGCKDCGNKMGIFYVEAVKKDISEDNVKEEQLDKEPVRKGNRKN
jgi:hypothetical protein